MLFALGFVSLFITGRLSGIFLGQPALDLYFHDTYFVVGHFHIMGVAAIFGMFAGTFYWFPKMFGRMMTRPWAKSTSTALSWAFTRFLPLCITWHRGQPAALFGLTNFDFLGKLLPVHVFMTHAAYFTAAGRFCFLSTFSGV